MAGLCSDPFRMRRAVERHSCLATRQDPRGDGYAAARTSTIASDTGRYRAGINGTAQVTAGAVADNVEVIRQDRA